MELYMYTCRGIHLLDRYSVSYSQYNIYFCLVLVNLIMKSKWKQVCFLSFVYYVLLLGVQLSKGDARPKWRGKIQQILSLSGTLIHISLIYKTSLRKSIAPAGEAVSLILLVARSREYVSYGHLNFFVSNIRLL